MPGLLQVQLGLLRDVARVAAVLSPVTGSFTKHVDVQRAVLRERVHVRRVGVEDQEHVRLLDLLEPADRRSVERPIPSSNRSSVSSAAGTEKCCIWPGRSEKRKSTISAPLSFARCMTSFGVATDPSPSSLDDVFESLGAVGRDDVSSPLTLRNEGTPAPSAPGSWVLACGLRRAVATGVGGRRAPARGEVPQGPSAPNLAYRPCRVPVRRIRDPGRGPAGTGEPSSGSRDRGGGVPSRG